MYIVIEKWKIKGHFELFPFDFKENDSFFVFMGVRIDPMQWHHLISMLKANNIKWEDIYKTLDCPKQFFVFSIKIS